MRQRFVVANGLRLHLADLGGEGPPVLLLHGVTSHWAAFLALADALGAERRCLAMDLRGHGDSQWSPEEAYATRDLANDVIAVLESLHSTQIVTGPIDVVGASWGGLAALLAAADRPELVSSLAVIDVPPSWTQAVDDVPPRPESFATHADVVAFERPRYSGATDAAIDGLAAFGTRPGPGGRLYFKYDPLFRSRWGFRSEDHWSALSEVRVPTLVVRAGGGGALAADVAQRMVDALPRGSFAEVPKSGHSVHLDAPDALAATLEAFWRDH